MTFWTITILSIYLVAILIIGLLSSKGAGKNAESFFVANRTLTWLQESMAVFTAIAPAGALLGTVGLFYKGGGMMLGYLFGFSLIMPITYWYIGSRLRRLGRLRGYQTQAVFIRDFYQSDYLRWGVAIVGIGASIPYFMVSPVGLGELLHQFAGVSYGAGVLIFVIIATAYTLKGGLRAVANTDILHGILLLVLLLGSVAVLVHHGGGFGRVLNQPQAMVPMSGTGITLFLAWFYFRGCGACVEPDRSFRMFAVRDESNMRRGVIMSAAMVSFAAFSYYAIGLAVRTFIPDLVKTDQTFSDGLEVAAAWMVPWFVMNCWGGGMSSFTCNMLSSSNIFIKDLFEPWYLRKHKMTDEKRDRLIVRTSRLVILILALITLCVAFFPPPFIWTLINLRDGLLAQFFPMFILGFAWRGITSLGVKVGWTCGVLSVLMWVFVFQPPFGARIPMSSIDAVAVNFIITIALSLATKEKQENKDMREELRRLGSPEAEAERAAVAAAPTVAV